MMKIKKLTAVLFCFIMVVSLIGCSMGSDEKATSEKKKDGNKKVIGVSLMTLQYEFFQDIKAGIEEEAGDDYEIVFNDPNMDLQAQIDAIENFCAQKVDAIILTCVDGDGIIPALDTCEEANIPVITVDYKPSGGKYETYIGSDNFLGGQLAAKWAIENVLADNENPNIVFLSNPMSIAAVERINGFKDILEKERPGAKVVAEQGGDSRESFMSIMEDVLLANDRIDLVFSYGAQGGLGSYDAIQAAGREDEVSVIGFDASDEEQAAIAEGGCYKGSIMQFPKKLAEACVDSVTKTLNGEKIEKDIAVEVGVYTADGVVYADDLK
ncbi:substrate-binding domain-containing protein [Faecalicatena sp. AGMB00832]|uniref:Substrate-binding domain-containing protein n=1 Tax=Faecalicatena faecalis TaxID=2726362 RepID=A0ABS6D1V4_9FIRM|nr:substrate-binding domain-containing protein [Faecalicatena faecalis]MBU3875582.1 substrate-binding domain-containing protein [Faecalicatena faecalis]